MVVSESELVPDVVSDLGKPFPEGVVEGLAANTWKHIYRDERDFSEMPNRGKLVRALMDGDLDAGIPELADRFDRVTTTDYPIYLWIRLLKRCPLGIPEHLIHSAHPHNNIVTAMSDEQLRLPVRRALILASIVKIHFLWQEMHVLDPSLQHPLVPIIAEWFKLDAPDARIQPLYYRLWRRLTSMRMK